MDKLIVSGGKKLVGEIEISGSKNAVLPILAATLLTDDACKIDNVPDLKDVRTMTDILCALGRNPEFESGSILVPEGKNTEITAPYDLVSTMRASVSVLGPLLAKCGRAKVSFPGGCVIGPRPINLHLKGLCALGAKIQVEEGYILASAKALKGANIYLGGHFGSSVLATANTLSAAVLAEGDTVIEDAACEPEISDLAKFLCKMGANIEGIGTPTLKVRGVKKLHGCEHRVIPDRIEAGTFMIAAAATHGKLLLKGAQIGHNLALADKLTECGAKIKAGEGFVEVSLDKRKKGATHITTLTYPGFPTDLQAQMMSLVALGDGISVITEKIYPDRFIHISELNRMGADIMLEGSTAIVNGVPRFSGAQVMASDLRASAALVIAGLCAYGDTEISRIYHLDRGYEHIEEKLSKVGAEIKRVN